MRSGEQHTPFPAVDEDPPGDAGRVGARGGGGGGGGGARHCAHRGVLARSGRRARRCHPRAEPGV